MAEYDLGTYGATIELDTSTFEQGMQNAENQMGNADKQTKGFAKNIGVLATGAIAGLGTALVGVGAVGVKMANDLDKSLRQLQGATGATDEEMKGMEDSLKNIYSAGYGESFEDIANAMATVKQNTGLAGAELEKTTKNAIAMSDTFDMDVNESTRTAKALMEKFGVSSDQAYNLIAQGAQNGANKNGDLLDSLNEYAPQFAAMGFSAEEFTNVLIDGAKTGQFSIDKVGDSIKEFNLRAKDGSESTNDAFKSLGLNADQMGKNFAAGGETAQKSFQQVVSALNNVKDPMEQNRIATALFGTQFEDLQKSGIEAFNNIGTTASLSKDALGKINEVKYDSFGAAVTGIYRSLQVALIEPFQKHVLPLLNQFAQFIQAHMPQIQATISTIFSAIGAVIGGFIETVKKVISTFKETETSTNTSFTKIQTTISTILETIKGIITDVTTVIKSLWKKYGDDLVKFATTAWNAISQVISGVLSVIRGIINTVLGLLTGDWDRAWNGIKQILSGVWDIIKGTIQTTLNTIQSIISTVLTVISNIFRTIWDGISTGVSAAFTWIKNTISTKLEDAKSSVSTILSKIATFFSDSWDNIKTKTSEIFGNIKETIVDKITEIKDEAGKLPSKIGTAITDKISDATGAIKDLAGKLVKKFKEALGINSPSKVFEDLGGWIIKGLVNGLSVSNLKEFGKNVLKDFGGGILDSWDSIKGFFTGSGAGGNVKSWIAQAMSITGVPSSWANALETIAMKESGGNPKAFNDWDINAKRGTPSMGLMQTIRPTFDAYKMKGFNDILNPVHNAIAAIRYIISRYGNVFNVPGIKSMARGGKYRGYYKGGIVDQKHLAWVAEHGREAIIPLEQKRYMAPFADAVYQRLRDNFSKHRASNSSNTTNNHTANYSINLSVENLNGTKNDAKMMLNEIVKGVKTLGGTI